MATIEITSVDDKTFRLTKGVISTLKNKIYTSHIVAKTNVMCEEVGSESSDLFSAIHYSELLIDGVVPTSAQDAVNKINVIVFSKAGSSAATTVIPTFDNTTNTLTLTDSDGNTQSVVIPDDKVLLVNDLTTGGTNKALTAEQGKQLKILIDGLPQPKFIDDPVTPADAYFDGNAKVTKKLTVVETLKAGKNIAIPFIEVTQSRYMSIPPANMASMGIYSSKCNIYLKTGLDGHPKDGKAGSAGSIPRNLLGIGVDSTANADSNFDFNDYFNKDLFGLTSLIRISYSYGEKLVDKGVLNAHPDMYAGTLFTSMGSLSYEAKHQWYFDIKGQIFTRGFGAYGDANWKKVVTYSNKTYVHTYTASKNLSNGDAVEITTTPSYTIKAGKKIRLRINVPIRNNSINSWGGIYVNPNIKINGNWVDGISNLGNRGFDKMVNGAAIIESVSEEYIIDLPTQMSLTDDYTVEVELMGRSYDGTTIINGSHDINGQHHNLNSRGKLNPAIKNQNFTKIIIEEID